MLSELEASRDFWECASRYPATKENVYATHAEAHEFDAQAGRHVLEYGCGGGADTLSLLRRGATVTATDIVPTNVKVTADRASAMLQGIHGAVARTWPAPGREMIEVGGVRRLAVCLLERSAPLPFRPATFDTVNVHGVLHHISEPRPILEEFYRVLKPGGVIYAMLYTEHLWARCRPVMEGLVGRGLTWEQAFGAVTDGSGCPYARAYTETEGRLLLAACGFEVDRAFEYNARDFRTFRGRKP